MSSTGALPTNTGHLVLRVDPDNPLSVNNTFILDKYGKPVPTGTILLTGPNGTVRADTSISSFNVSSLTTREIFTSSIQASGVDIVSNSQTLVFDSTTTLNTYVIPNNVMSIDFQIIGAAGASITGNDINSGIGGNGAYISGSINVSNSLAGKTLNLQPGICYNGTKNSSTASYISIVDDASENALLVVAGSGGNGGYASSAPTYQAEGGAGGAEDFIPFGELNAGVIAPGLPGTTTQNQTVVTAGQGGQIAPPPVGTPPATPVVQDAPGGTAGATNASSTGATNGPKGTAYQLLSVLGGSGGILGSYYGGSGGGGYSGGGGGNISSDGTIASGGGGGSSYYAADYIGDVASASGKNLKPGMLPSYGRASHIAGSSSVNGAIVLRINKSPALSTRGDIDCSGNIQCNILKYNILDPPLYVTPSDAWSNIPAEGPVDISNYNLNNVKVLNVSTVFANNGVQLSESQGPNAERPALSAQLLDYEIRGLSDNDNDAQGSVGFLQLTAGNQPTTMSYIQLSGNSQNTDMNQNIVLGTSGGEQARISSIGLIVKNGLSATTGTFSGLLTANNGLTVTSGGANIVGNTNIQPNAPTATDAFKIELDGTNFLVYKDGTTNTVLNNTGGPTCNLVLSSSNTVIVNNNTVINGSLKLNNGSGASPGLYFNADQNTGIYGISDGTMGISADGFERIKVTSGDITLTPNSGNKVNINGAATITGAATVTGTLNANNGLTITSGTLSAPSASINGTLNMNNNKITNQLLNIIPYDTITIANNYNNYVILPSGTTNISLTTTPSNGTFIYFYNNSGNNVTIATVGDSILVANKEIQQALYYNGWILPRYSLGGIMAPVVIGRYILFNGDTQMYVVMDLYSDNSTSIIASNGFTNGTSVSIIQSYFINYRCFDYILIGGGGGGSGSNNILVGGVGGGSGYLVQSNIPYIIPSSPSISVNVGGANTNTSFVVNGANGATTITAAAGGTPNGYYNGGLVIQDQNQISSTTYNGDGPGGGANGGGGINSGGGGGGIGPIQFNTIQLVSRGGTGNNGINAGTAGICGGGGGGGGGYNSGIAAGTGGAGYVGLYFHN